MNVMGSKVNKKPNYHASHGAAGGLWGCWSRKVMNGMSTMNVLWMNSHLD